MSGPSATYKEKEAGQINQTSSINFQTPVELWHTVYYSEQAMKVKREKKIP